MVYITNAPFAGDGRKLVHFENKIWALGGFKPLQIANVEAMILRQIPGKAKIV